MKVTDMNKIVPLNVANIRKAEGTGPLLYRGTSASVIERLRPAVPLYIVRPEAVAQATRAFIAGFPGEAMFAVKTNPDKAILQIMAKNGMKSFDAASIDEVRLVKKAVPKATVYFMHPVKAPEAIREAYFEHGVRNFVLDSKDELYKILRETELAADLNLFVRLGLPKNGKAAIDFSTKFGAAPDDAAELLRLCRPVSAKLGLAFHVGTQSRDPSVYGRAVGKAADVIRASGVTVDSLDVGGGYPVSYIGEIAPETEACFDSLKKAVKREKLSHLQLLAEPGRVLVAESSSLVVRVEARKDGVLYINDGIYGGLFDAGPLLNLKYPVRAVSSDKPFEGDLVPFSFMGPTCDSLDFMKGPFYLPADIGAGDWIEVCNTGAYSAALRGNFNGFGKANQVFLKEE
jgi:ornithine decarboxylase